MKKLIHSAFILSILFLSFSHNAAAQAQQLHGEHVEVTEEDMQAMLNPVEDDTLQQAGQELDAIISEAIRRYRNEETKPVDFGNWMVYLASILASFLAFLKKWGPSLKRRFENVKGDTVAYIVSALIGVGWMLIDGGTSFENFFMKFSAVFTLAVGAYKVVLANVWEWLRGLFVKPAPQDAAL